jgi:hypothetical protein
VRRLCGAVVGFVALWLGACTYGPEEQRIRIEQIVPLGDSFLALVTVRHDRFRPPTGLSAFPDGGKALILRRRALQYLVDGRERTARLFVEREAPDELWESFHMRVAGLDGDSVVYVAMTGCPRGGECWGELQRTSYHRVTMDGSVRAVDGVPDRAGLPGTMLARRQGEVNFIRWSTDRDTVTVRLLEGGPFEPSFVVSEDGTLTAVGR